MSLNLEQSELAALWPRLSPYLRRQLKAAGDHARRLHADEVTLEHLAWTLMRDEDSALFVAVDQAFADPETVAADLLSLCSGILVSTRAGAVPFSTRGVAAARAARELACERGLAQVDNACLLVCALDELEDELSRDLVQAGLDPQAARAALASGDAQLPREGHLFKHFASETRQALVVAARQATAAHEDSIGPARMAAAALAGDEQLAERCGLTARRAKLCIEGRAADDTPAPARLLEPDPQLLEALACLPAGASTLTLAAHFLLTTESELAQVFERQKITRDLLTRAASAYDDPLE